VGQAVYIASCAGTVAAVDKKEGQPIWSQNLEIGSFTQPQFHADVLFARGALILNSDAYETGGLAFIYAFARTSGTQLWRQAIASGSMSDVAWHGRYLFLVTLQDTLLCIDLSNGHHLWSRKTDPSDRPPRRIRTAPTVQRRQIFFGDQNGTVHALTQATGSLQWRANLGSAVTAGILVTDRVLYLGTEANDLYRLDSRTGATRSRIATDGMPYGPIVHRNSRLLVFANRDRPGGGKIQTVVAVDLALSRVIWTNDNDSRGWTTARPYLSSQCVLLGDEAGRIVGLALKDGSQQWSGSVSGTVRSIGVSAEDLYVGTVEGRLIRYSPYWGPHSVCSSP
jgi:eukaryotic-like serine/threonine-protein kinase